MVDEDTAPQLAGRYWRSIEGGSWVRVTAQDWAAAEARREPDVKGCADHAHAVLVHTPPRQPGESVQEWRSRCRFMSAGVGG